MNFYIIKNSKVVLGPKEYNQQLFKTWLKFNEGLDVTLPSSSTSAVVVSAEISILPEGETVSVPINQKTQQPSGPFYTIINNTVNVEWQAVDKSLDQIKGELKAQLASIRYENEIKGITINGAAIDTSRSSQAMINGAYTFSLLNPTLTVDWKNSDGTWSQIDAATISAIASAVASHVQNCFRKEKELSTTIDSASDSATLDGIDLTAGW